ncbi:thiol:disulfide interchange protein [Methylovorus sp. MM2]|nr:thiol:disulfide interchange protein [Methylovorus sp. MM2]
MSKSLLYTFRALLAACLLLFTLSNNIAMAGFSSSSKSSFLGSSEDTAILEPDQAFKLDITAKNADTLDALFIIAPGHYLYRDRIKFEVKSPQNATVSTELPHGEMKQDATFGETEVFHHDIEASLKLAFASQPPETITLIATYQGCSEKGLCYAPIKKILDIPLDSTSLSSANDDPIASLLKSGKFWLVAVGFFGFGLLLSLSPCVLPMIPILSGIIIGDKRSHHQQTSKLHTFNLSLAYTLGMAVTYTLAGIAAGLSGKLLSNTLQTPWALGGMALLFVLLSLSMFGFYELKLPQSIENRVLNVASRFKGGRFIGVFIMGIFSALVVSPCVVAPLAGILLYISQTHNVILGGIALFTLSLGMGVPLLLIGASAGSLLPKAGAWMESMRQFFGVVMLAVAIWLITPIIPNGVQLLLWAALLIIPAIYMHALDSLPTDASKWAKLWKGVAIIMLLLGIAMVTGAVSGAKSPLQPLAGLKLGSAPQDALPFQRVKNLAELEAAIKASPNQIVMLDFYADWCVACKELEQFTFSDPRVKTALKNVTLLQADVTQNAEEDVAMLKRFGLFGPPGIVFFASSGNEITDAKVIGYQNADQFLLTLNKLAL